MTLARIQPAHELERRGWAGRLEDAAGFARGIAGTDFVPRALRNNPAAIAAAILYGDEIGLPPMQSLARIAVIEGRPSLSAEAQRALVLAGGHELWLDEWTATRATWCGRRAGSDNVTRVTWTMDDARRANLAGKQNWRTYPREMLSARASAALVRAVFADVVGGLGAVEEFEDVQEGAANVAGSAPASDPRGKRRRPRAAVAATPDPPQTVEDDGTPRVPARGVPEGLPPLPGELEGQGHGSESAPEPLEQTAAADELELELEPPAMTDAQRRRMHAAFRAVGITDRAERLRYSGTIIGRTLKSAKELTSSEADRLTDALELERRETDEALALAEQEGAPDPEEGF